jgi:hypothetical protein
VLRIRGKRELLPWRILLMKLRALELNEMETKCIFEIRDP